MSQEAQGGDICVMCLGEGEFRLGQDCLGSGSVVTGLLRGRRQACQRVKHPSAVCFNGKTAADTQRLQAKC